MYAYKIDDKGNIVEELLDVNKIPQGYIGTEQKLDATIHMYVNGSVMMKPKEAPKKQIVARLTNEQKLQSIRELRDILLVKTDWTQTLDAPISAEKQEEYRVYRQALRELPSRADLDLDNPIFPKKP